MRGVARLTAPLPNPDAYVVPHWTDIDWHPNIKNHVVDDRQLRYVDCGSGPTMVLLHGIAASWQWWLENIPTLAQRHRVIAVALPGFGPSEPLPAGAEMSAYARAVLDLLAELNVRAATVVGH